jgi:hypothetical protein
MPVRDGLRPGTPVLNLPANGMNEFNHFGVAPAAMMRQGEA